MADESTDQGGNRATIAQTLAEVRGLRDFLDARLGDVQRQLDRVGDLPVTVSALQAQNYDQEKRIRALEEHAKGDKEWRRTHLPSIVLTAVLAIVGILELLPHLHFH